MKSRKIWILFAVAAVAVSEARAEFRAGAARRVITPDPLLPVSGGLGAPRTAKEKRGDLEVGAIVFENGGTRVAFVSLDLLGFPSVLGNRVRKAVSGVKPENILIGATHTHSAPDTYAFPDGKGGHTGDLAYMDRVCKLAAEAIDEAVAKLAPARLRVGGGEAKGKIAYNYYAPDLYDRRMSVLRFERVDGKAIASLVNYAIHPEVLGNEVGILSPDLVGPLRDRVAEAGGGLCLFMNGAQGGMITADNRDLSQPRDPLRAYWNDLRAWSECERIGRLMADEAARLLGNAPLDADPKVGCAGVDVAFPVESDLMWAVIVGSPLGYPRNADRTVTVRVALVDLGDARILTIPGEALPNIGFYLKRKMNGKQNMLFGLTNEAFGYILTKVDFKSFPRYDYVSRTSLGEMTGEILIEKSLDLIARTPRP
jgi:hypothetical protein